MKYKRELWKHGGDILRSPGMQLEKTFLQHGDITVYDHSLLVARGCLVLADRLPLRVNRRSLVRGALLHDYFLYDWHEDDPSHRLHGFFHAEKALKNARRDFELTGIEEDMIHCHMFPLNLRIPKTKEGKILCVVDKACATYETLRGIALALGRSVRSRGTC